VNFIESSARRQVSIVKNGPRCGVFTLILRDTAKALPYGFNLKDLEDSATLITMMGETLSPDSFNGCFVWEEPDFEDLPLDLDGLPSQEISRSIIKKSGELAAEGMKKEVPFERLVTATLKKDSWQICSAAENLQVPLGPAGRGVPQQLTLGGGQEAHALLVGRTGSGKTNLMHVIVTNLALTYSPKELQLYLIDFKGGVGFKRYAEYRLPHAKVIAIESEREFGMSVLRGLDAEMKKRSDLFRAAGVDNLTSYRAKNHADALMPRILLVVDEFQEFFTENDDTSQQAKIIFDRLARQGRSFGLHFLLATQSLSGSAQLPSSIMGQIKVRIALPCSEADSRLILADDNKAARSLSLAGEAIYNPLGGLVEGNNKFQVARFDENKDLQKYLGMIVEMARDQQLSTVPIIFEGNELARAEDCESLKELLAASDWPQPAKGVDLYLGEPIAILPPVAARLRRQSGSNMMILTRDESEGVGMCVLALLSILAQQRVGSYHIYIADFTTADSEWAEHAEEIARCFPGEITVIGRQRETGAMFAAIAGEVRLRSENVSAQRSIFLVLQGMHRIKSLRENMDDEDGNNSVELLQTILRDGPEVGVHVIAWADTLDNATRGMSRKALGEFGLRVGAVMNSGDSMNFLDDLAASKISKPHRAVFLDEDRPGQLVTFRPYAMPSAEWLGQAGQTLHSRMQNRNAV
jgi:S-DNA-T family DNA segregation ATPase FtsK/SpoIIIE